MHAATELGKCLTAVGVNSSERQGFFFVVVVKL